MLLNEEEIRTALDAQFKDLEPTVAGLRLAPPGLDFSTLSAISSSLGEGLPSEFAALTSTYNFGSLTIGPIAFGNSGSYDRDVRKYNEPLDSTLSWWGPGPRPRERIMIANSDATAFLLDCRSGAVLALKHGRDVDECVRIASDFQKFVRGVGSVFLLRDACDARDTLGALIASEVGAGEDGRQFWQELAS